MLPTLYKDVPFPDFRGKDLSGAERTMPAGSIVVITQGAADLMVARRWEVLLLAEGLAVIQCLVAPTWSTRDLRSFFPKSQHDQVVVVPALNASGDDLLRGSSHWVMKLANQRALWMVAGPPVETTWDLIEPYLNANSGKL